MFKPQSPRSPLALIQHSSGIDLKDLGPHQQFPEEPASNPLPEFVLDQMIRVKVITPHQNSQSFPPPAPSQFFLPPDRA